MKLSLVGYSSKWHWSSSSLPSSNPSPHLQSMLSDHHSTSHYSQCYQTTTLPLITVNAIRPPLYLSLQSMLSDHHSTSHYSQCYQTTTLPLITVNAIRPPLYLSLGKWRLTDFLSGFLSRFHTRFPSNGRFPCDRFQFYIILTYFIRDIPNTLELQTFRSWKYLSFLEILGIFRFELVATEFRRLIVESFCCIIRQEFKEGDPIYS